MAMLKVDGVELPTPSGYVVSLNELSKSERNANGTMIKEVIGYKYKVEAGWNLLTQVQMSVLMAVKRKNFFTLDFIDMDTGQPKTGTFYASDPKAKAMRFKDNRVDKWLDIKMSFVER